MKSTAFDSITRELSERANRRGFLRLLGGATALGIGSISLSDAADARRKRKPAKTKGKGTICKSWILSGGPSATAQLSVDDDLRITLNGVNILSDANTMADNLPPAPFAGKLGDSLAVIATDTNAACRSVSPIWLHCATSGEKRQLSAGQNDGCAPGRTPGVFFSKVFTVKL